MEESELKEQLDNIKVLYDGLEFSYKQTLHNLFIDLERLNFKLQKSADEVERLNKSITKFYERNENDSDKNKI